MTYGHDEAISDLYTVSRSTPDFTATHYDRLAAYITTLEADNAALVAVAKALEAEHEAVGRVKDAWGIGLGTTGASVLAAHDHAEKEIR